MPVSRVTFVFMFFAGFCNLMDILFWECACLGMEIDLVVFFVFVFQAIFRGAMKGKLIVNCPLPPERIPKYQLLYKDV